MPISDRLSELGRLVEHGGRLAQEMRGQGIERELKEDGSIVTRADRAVEEYLRDHLPALSPGSTIWGEEYGFTDEGVGGLWVVDPIDGTSNFGFGSPLWGVSAALVQGEEITLGAVYLPDLNELYISEKGGGVYRNGKALPNIKPGPVQPEELLSYSDGLIRKVGDFPLPGKMRLAGAFVIDGTFTACQRYRGLIGHKERLYDIGACILFGQELGADIRYADGSPFLLGPLKEPQRLTKPWLIFPKDSGFYIPSATK